MTNAFKILGAAIEWAGEVANPGMRRHPSFRISRTATIAHFAIVFFLSFHGFSSGGYVTVPCDPGSTVSIDVEYSDGTTARGNLTDTTGQGGVVFGPLPMEDKILFYVDATVLHGQLHFQLNMFPSIFLAGAEPFKTPSFIDASTPGTPIIAFFNFDSYNPTAQYSLGSSYAVNGGSISQVPGLTFYVGSGLPADPNVALTDVLNQSYLDALPLFTGTVQVAGFESAAVPEPASLAMLGMGLAGVGLAASLRRRVN